MSRGRHWDKHDLHLLRDCTKVPSRSALNKRWISWERISHLMNEQADDRHQAFGPFSAMECISRYERSLVFTLSGGDDFDPDDYGIDTLPWSKEEIERLQCLLPIAITGGKNKSCKHLAVPGQVNWEDIAQRMNAEGDGQRRYTANSVLLAHTLRITSDYYKDLDGASVAGSPTAAAALEALELSELIMHAPDDEDHMLTRSGSGYTRTFGRSRVSGGDFWTSVVEGV